MLFQGLGLTVKLDFGQEETHQVLLDIHREEIARAAVHSCSLGGCRTKLVISRRKNDLKELRIAQLPDFIGVEKLNQVIAISLGRKSVSAPIIP